MIDDAIQKLVLYGIEKGLIQLSDRIYTTNRILEVLQKDDYTQSPLQKKNSGGISLEPVLKEILDYAVQKGLIEDSIVYRDLFDTKIMGCLTAPPHEVIKKFYDLHEISSEMSTDWYYEFSQNTDYIRKCRIEKDLRWSAETPYGILDLSINLSKPEKDPKAIAAAKTAKQSTYPKCMLCAENEGYAGRINHPARENHRVIPLTINDEPWYFQYSPYVYYNEHCIAFNGKHIPMVINKETFRKLFDFLNLFPHYFIGSNADLPIVGGSILSHDHFQGGRYEFAMERAGIEKHITISGYEDVEAGIVKWPLSVIRLRHKNENKLTELADYILNKWRSYSDESAFIFAQTNGEPHNTITPIARKKGKIFELDLVLRNNITTEEYPLGVYHPHANLHHIKKENIGLIEVMGLAVLPARLDRELKTLAQLILEKKDLRENVLTAKHADWAEEFIPNYNFTKENIMEILEHETGQVFVKVLEDAGVFKRNTEGALAFERFINIL